jgi:hypothetical protein
MGRKKKKEEPNKPKSIRKDVSKRKEDNKNTEFSCVKCSFNSLVENNIFFTVFFTFQNIF